MIAVILKEDHATLLVLAIAKVDLFEEKSVERLPTIIFKREKRGVKELTASRLTDQSG